MRKKKNLAARQAKKIAKDAHNLDEDTKGLHKLVKQSKKNAERFHKDAHERQKKVEITGVKKEKGARLTESALQKSAEEQLADFAMVGHSTKKSA